MGNNDEAYKQSSYYQNLGIDKLQEQLSGYQTDDATLRQQAEAQYKPTYDAELQALQHQTQQQIQGYNSQLAGLGSAYDQQRQQTNDSYNESILSASNALTRRGLGRSSLVATQGAYLENKRNQALSQINADQTAAVNAINEKIALLTDQAAQSEKLLAGNYASQIEARMNELKQQNQTAATNLQLQIAALQQEGYNAWVAQQNADRDYQTQQQQYADQLAQQQWQNQFNEQQYQSSLDQWLKEFEAQQALQQQNQANADREYELALREMQLAEDQFAFEKEQATKKSSGGGSSDNGGSYTPTPTPDAQDSDNLLDMLMGVGGTIADTANNATNGLLGKIAGAVATAAKPIATGALVNAASSVKNWATQQKKTEDDTTLYRSRTPKSLQ